jgi:hypothetical protein
MTTFTVTEPEKRFFLHSGAALWSLEELFAELQHIEPHQFSHHVGIEKHDFAKWVKDCFGDHFLAKQMEQAKTPDELQKIVFVSLFR